MKIGIYGGSFSPPHKGHEKLAMHFLEVMELDRLIVLPAGNPPHKKIDGGANGRIRLDMCRAAFLALSEKITVSDFEALRTDPCYTVDTLRHFATEGELYMLCGSDMLLTLDSWRDPQGIFDLATVVCGTRSDDPETEAALEEKAELYREKFGGKCVIMDFDPVEISSTEVRAALRSGHRPVEISDGVYNVIVKHELYGHSGGVGDGI